MCRLLQDLFWINFDEHNYVEEYFIKVGEEIIQYQVFLRIFWAFDIVY